MRELPVVCDLQTLTPEERERQRDLFARLSSSVSRVDELEEGLRLRLPAEKLMEAAELMSLESRCCRFLTLRLDVEAAEGRVSLTLSGPPGTKELLKAEIERFNRA